MGPASWAPSRRLAHSLHSSGWRGSPRDKVGLAPPTPPLLSTPFSMCPGFAQLWNEGVALMAWITGDPKGQQQQRLWSQRESRQIPVPSIKGPWAWP